MPHDSAQVLKKCCSTADTKELPITVICVESSTISIPHDNSKHKARGFCLICPFDSQEVVVNKLNQVFDKKVKMLRATKSNDLFEIDYTNGKELLEMIGTGC
jgi:hypothetical protein